MSSKCKAEQVKRDGTSQPGRYLKALDPANTPLDDRSVEDILVFAKHYAGLVRFYDKDEPVEWATTGNGNDQNQNQGGQKGQVYDWKEFFYKDIAVVIASIAGYKNRLGEINLAYEEKRKKIDQSPDVQNFKSLFGPIWDLMHRIERWYDRSIPGHPLKAELELKINSVLKPASKKLRAYYRGIRSQKDSGIETGKEYALPEDLPWGLKNDPVQDDESIYVGNDIAQKIKHAALYVDDIFQQTLKVYKEITDRADYYFSVATENYADHEPHMALFIAFVKLFMHVQKEMNGLTQRHLEFYYRDVLRLHERPAEPDAVYIIYELAKEAIGYDLKKDTALTVGKDATGKELIYKTESALSINKAKVKELKTVFLDKAKDELIQNIYAATVANSLDGNGAPFKEAETSWPSLGYVQLYRKVKENGDVTITNPRDIIGKEAEVGFAIASPQLFLAEGKRKVKVTIRFEREKEKADDKKQALEKIGFRLLFTGEKEWVDIGIEAPIAREPVIESDKMAKMSITPEATILISEQGIIAYNKQIHGGNFQTNYPVMKFVVADAAGYDFLKTAIIKDVSITVDVTGMKHLILENDLAVLDPSKVVLPFTQTPKQGYSFYIGSREIFYKKLDSLSLHFDSIEQGDLIRKEGDDTKSALLNIAFLNRNGWGYTKQKAAGTDNNPNFPHQYSSSINVLEESVLLSNNNREINYTGFPVKANALAGFMRIDLMSEIETSVVVEKEGKKVILPKTFILKNPEINYTSTESYVAGIEQLFHLYPFGSIEIFSAGELDENTKPLLKKLEDSTNNLLIPTPVLLPQFKSGKGLSFKEDYKPNQYDFTTCQQGNLYIGVENLKPPQNLSLLFKIADGTAVDNDALPPKINWSFLVNNEWRALPRQNIISDTTYGLQTTGIILFDFPEDATNNNTVITTGLHWLCASVDQDADRLPKLINIVAQANKAVLFDQQNDPNHYKLPLPAGSITKLSVKVPEIKVIQQPFESFDGKMREEGKVFYARASERLRHKHRAITPWDYEHLVLQHFPSVYKVKCIAHTDPDCICRNPRDSAKKMIKERCCCGQVAPGHVLIVPVSNLRNKESVDFLKPRTGRRVLIQVEDYLKKLTSPFVHVKARNPKFEEIRTSFYVKFTTGTDKGRYLKKLNEDIIKFLTPWAFDRNKEVVFGGIVYASGIINFIEELEYVDYITCFRMIHIVNGCCKDDSLRPLNCDEMKKDLDHPVEKDKDGKTIMLLKERCEAFIEASSPMAILTSARQHCIDLVEENNAEDDCKCLKPKN